MSAAGYTAATAPVYVWQMNDGRWHISPRWSHHGRADWNAANTEAAKLITGAGLDGGADARADLVERARTAGFRV